MKQHVGPRRADIPVLECIGPGPGRNRKCGTGADRIPLVLHQDQGGYFEIADGRHVHRAGEQAEEKRVGISRELVAHAINPGAAQNVVVERQPLQTNPFYPFSQFVGTETHELSGPEWRVREGLLLTAGIELPQQMPWQRRDPIGPIDIAEDRRLREQLIHSERLSAVGQLVAGVAHEINNPLQAVMGFAELLIGSDTNPEIRRDLEQIRSDADRAAKIVRHLLQFARRSTLERAVADLNEIARATCALRTYELKMAGIEIIEQYSNDMPVVVANREEIQQVVLNLLLNAEHALRGHGRGSTIRVTTGETADSAYLEVVDNGAGVPDAAASRIFEPFFTTKGVGQGTGLGLSVSLGIAQAHSGTLELKPTAEGACFRLTLPAATDMRVNLALPTSA